MSRRKKEIELLSTAMVESALQEHVEETATAQVDEKPAPKKRGRKKKEYVTLDDVVATNPAAKEIGVTPIVHPETPLSKITIFDGVENVDESLTYRIPEIPPEDDGEFHLKGRGEFVDNPAGDDMLNWIPTDEQRFFVEKDGMIFTQYLNKVFDVPEDRQILYYIIAKKHYKEIIPDLVHHINYFISHYDMEQEFLVASLSIKNYIDRHPDMTQKSFHKMVKMRILTNSFVSKVKHMAMDLYKLNINTDKDGKYKTTPKITNDHARMIVAVSFCLRLILPLCIHFSNTNATFVNKRDYIDCFDRIFMSVIDKFEEGDTAIWNPICRFVAYRVERSYNSDIIIWEKKKQLYGTTVEIYLESLIHEVILVKSLHKLTYTRSIVSFIDGIITNGYMHYRYENFKFKPVEIEVDDNDSDDYLSHVESLEMMISRVDESNQLIGDVNTAQVMIDISKRFNIDIPEEEFQFYFDNIRFNSLSQSLLHAFFSKYFSDSNAIFLLDKTSAVRLTIYLKHYLQLRGMTIMPQMLTASIKGKFKDNCIKNTKFLEKFTTSSVYQHIISDKYKYIRELGLKEDPIVKLLSTMINSQFCLVDTDMEVNGRECDSVNVDVLVSEFMLFLSIC